LAAQEGKNRLSLFLPPEMEVRYEILRPIGQGGMGQVFLAESKKNRDLVAIKVLRFQNDEQHAQRFRRECQIMERLRHPHIIRLLEYGDGEGGAFLVMPYVEGKPLDDGPPPDNPLAFMMQVGEALQAVHDLGLVHRDVKPSNIMVDHNQEPVLIDFGIVFDESRTRMTQTGGMVGTLSYMAPELLEGVKAGPAADWFAWGITAYQLLEGHPPFLPGEVMAAIHERNLPPVTLKELRRYPVLAEASLWCLSFEPTRRPRHIDQMKGLLKLPECALGRFLRAEKNPAAGTGERSKRLIRNTRSIGGFARLASPKSGVNPGSQLDQTYELALDLIQVGDLIGAESILRKVVYRDPRHLPALRELCFLLVEEKQFEEALRPFQEAIAMDPEDPELLFFQGVALDRLGRGEEAELYFRRFLGVSLEDCQSARKHAQSKLKSRSLPVKDPTAGKETQTSPSSISQLPRNSFSPAFSFVFLLLLWGISYPFFGESQGDPSRSSSGTYTLSRALALEVDVFLGESNQGGPEVGRIRDVIRGELARDRNPVLAMDDFVDLSQLLGKEGRDGVPILRELTKYGSRSTALVTLKDLMRTGCPAGERAVFELARRWGVHKQDEKVDFALLQLKQSRYPETWRGLLHLMGLFADKRRQHPSYGIALLRLENVLKQGPPSVVDPVLREMQLAWTKGERNRLINRLIRELEKVD
jgi:serine/threonine protein kinase